MAWIGPDSPARLHLVRRLAEQLGHRHRHTPDDDARLVPKRCVAGCLGRVPRCRVEPFDRMAVLSVRAADRRTTGTDANGAGCSWRCRWRRLLWQIAAPEAWQFSRAFLPNKAQYFALGIVSASVVRGDRRACGAYLAVLAATSGALRTGRRHRQAAAAGGVDGMPCGAAHGVIPADRGVTSLGSCFRKHDAGLAGRDAAVQAAGLAGRGLVLHLPGQRTRAEAAWALRLAFLTQGDATLFIATLDPRMRWCCRFLPPGGCTIGSSCRRSATAAASRWPQ